MIKSPYFPEKSFATKEELFKQLRLNADKIISCKKSEIYKSAEKGALPVYNILKTETSKAGPHMMENYFYPVINTTLYLDSHQDLHLNGIWDKSAKQQNGKLFYVTDHEIKTNTIIAWPQDVNVMVKSVPWAWVGKSYEGNTEALIYEIPTDKIVNDTAKAIIEQKRPVQNSVRMQYVRIKLAMNSSAKEDIEYKKEYDLHINSIANKDQAEKDGYFFAVYEAKIIREGSMVPLGSNDATPINQKTEADTITSDKIEPPSGTHKPAVKDTGLIKGLNNLLSLTKTIK